jgi:hypothetical protein
MFLVEIGSGENGVKGENMYGETYKLCTGGMKAGQPQLYVLFEVERIYSFR